VVIATDQPSADEASRVPPSPATGTIVDRFRSRVASQPARTALRHRRGDDWCDVTWGDYGIAVAEVATGLIDLGIERGDRVAVLSANRPEWHIADLAILSAGAVTVPVYPTSSSSQIAYVLADSGARVCFVDGAEQLAKVLLHLDELPDLDRLVVFADTPGLDHAARVIIFRDLCTRSTALDAVDERVNAIGRGDIATLVYTSGTTGPPKGTCITHGNISWTIDSMQSLVSLSSSDRWLSYLPLSHIAERVTSHFGQIVAGGETWFARSLATLPDDLRACRPTIFFAVPRVWQKFHAAILDDLHDKHLGLDTLVERRVDRSDEHVDDARPDRGEIRSVLAGAADKVAAVIVARTVAPVVRRRLGLDRARLLV
jgi:long-chain acyl-CoA synthetase